MLSLAKGEIMTNSRPKIKKVAIASSILTGIAVAGTAALLWQNHPIPLEKTNLPKTSVRTAEYAYDASFSLSIKNPKTTSADMLIKLPLLCGQDTFQTISGLEITPPPQSTSADTFGNPIAYYEFPNIQPNGTVTITQKAQITRIAFADLPDASSEPQGMASLSANSAYSPALLKETELAIGKETKTLYRAIRIYDWIRTFNFQLRNKPADYDTMLKTRTLQCADAARLTCALSQTAGIRATLVAGIVHRPEEPSSADLHSWCKIELPSCGSVHIDPTMGRFPEERNCRFAQLDGSSIILWKGPEEEVFTASFKTEGDVTADSSDASNQDSTEKNYINNEEICSKDFFVQLKKITPLKTELAQFVPNAQELTEEKNNASAQPQYPDTPEQLIKYINDNPEDLAASIIAAQMEISESQANLIKKMPDSPSARLCKAMFAIKNNCWSDADQLLSGDSAAPEVQFGRLILYTQTKQPLRALKAGREALKSRNWVIKQSAFDTILQIYFDLGDWYSAYEAASIAASQFSDPNFQMACARAAFKIGKDKEALQIAEEFSKNYPGDGYAWATLGVLYAERGDLKNALMYLNKALALNLEPQEHEYYVKLAINIKKAIASVNAQLEK